MWGPHRRPCLSLSSLRPSNTSRAASAAHAYSCGTTASMMVSRSSGFGGTRRGRRPSRHRYGIRPSRTKKGRWRKSRRKLVHPLDWSQFTQALAPKGTHFAELTNHFGLEIDCACPARGYRVGMRQNLREETAPRVASAQTATVPPEWEDDTNRAQRIAEIAGVLNECLWMLDALGMSQAAIHLNSAIESLPGQKPLIPLDLLELLD